MLEGLGEGDGVADGVTDVSLDVTVGMVAGGSFEPLEQPLSAAVNNSEARGAAATAAVPLLRPGPRMAGR